MDIGNVIISEHKIVNFLVVMLLVVSFIPTQNTALADGEGDYPAPSDGDWIISELTNVSDETILMNGNIFIENGGELHLENVTIILNASSDGQYRLDVASGGILNFYNSTIERGGEHGYGFWVNNGGKLRMEGSNVSRCGYNAWRYQGIFLDGDDVVIKNTMFYEGYYGIYSYLADGQIIQNNQFLNNTAGGIYSNTISNSQFSGNTMYHTNFGIWLYTCSNMIIDGNEVYNTTGQANALGIYAQNSYGITFSNNVVNDTDTGIYFHTTHNSTWHNNSVSYSRIGNRIYNSQDILVRDEGIYNNAYGLYVANGNYRITVDHCNASFNRVYNMYFYRTYDSLIEKNEIRDSTQYHGLGINECTGMTVRENTMSGMKSVGFYMLRSHNNTLIGNEITDSPYGYYPHLCNDNVFMDGVLKNDNYGFYVRGSKRHLFLNSSLSQGANYDVYLRDNSTEITLLNVEYSTAVVVDSPSLLTVKNFLDIEVQGRAGPIEGVDVEVKDFLTNEVIYSTPFYGGLDEPTDFQGKIDSMQALYSIMDIDGSTTSQVRIRINDHGLFEDERYLDLTESRKEIFIKNVITVEGQGNGDFESIQDAIDIAGRNETILVAEGDYQENLIIDDAVRIFGVGSNVTLDGGGGTALTSNGITTLANFTITNSSLDVDVEHDTVFYNVTFTDVELHPDHYFSVGYYLTVHTVMDDGEAVPGATVSIENDLGTNRSYTSDPNGIIKDIPLLGYKKLTDQHILINPHEITAIKRFLRGNYSLEIENNTELFIPLTRHGAFGSAVLHGDINHDGHQDYVVGAPLDDEAGTDAGAVFIYYGPDLESDVLRPVDADLVLKGKQMQNKFGSSLEIGDVNGDGLDDLIVGAPTYNNGEINGIRGQYYNGHDYTNWQYSRVDPNINFPWGDGGPPIVGADFAATWYGYIFITEENDYTFFFDFDDGVRLILDGDTIIEQMSKTGLEISSDAIHLTIGFHLVEIHFREMGGQGKLIFKWETPTMAKSVIPPEVFFLTNNIDPGNGAVYVFSGNLFDRPSFTISDGMILAGDHPEFGHYLSTGDMNSDGRDDLLVGYEGGTSAFHGMPMVIREPFELLPLLGEEWDPVINGSGESMSLSNSGNLIIEGDGSGYAYAMSRDLHDQGISFSVTLEKGMNARFLDAITYKLPREDVTNNSKQDESTIFSLRANGEILYWPVQGGDLSIAPADVGIVFTYEVHISESMDRLLIWADGKLVVDTPLTGWGSFYLKLGDSTKFGTTVNILEFSPSLPSIDITGWEKAVYLDDPYGNIAASMFGESYLFSSDFSKYFDLIIMDQDDFTGYYNFTVYEDGLTLFPYQLVDGIANGNFDNGWNGWSFIVNSQGQKKGNKRLTESETGDWKLSPYSGGPTAGFGSDGSYLDGLGGKCSGRLRSSAFTIEEDADFLTLWYHWKVISFDGSQNEGMNLKIYRASDNAVLLTVKNWMADVDSQSYEIEDFVTVSLEDLIGETVYLAMDTLGGDGGYDDGLAQLDDVSLAKENQDLKGDFTSELIDVGRNYSFFAPAYTLDENRGIVTLFYRTNDTQDWTEIVEGLNKVPEVTTMFQYRVTFEGLAGNPYPLISKIRFNFHEENPTLLQSGWPVLIDEYVDDPSLGIVNGTILSIYSGTTVIMNVTSKNEILHVASPLDMDATGSWDLVVTSEDQALIFLASEYKDLNETDADYRFTGETGYGDALDHPLVGSPEESQGDGRVHILPMYEENLAIIGVNIQDGQLIYPSETLRLTLRVKNIGLTRMENRSLALSITSQTDSYNTTTKVTLDPGEAIEVSFDWDVPAGENVLYTVTFTMDGDMQTSNDILELQVTSRYHGLRLATAKDYFGVEVNGTARFTIQLTNIGTLGDDTVTFNVTHPEGWNWWLAEDGINFTSIVVSDVISFDLYVKTSSPLDMYPIDLMVRSDSGNADHTIGLYCHVVDRDIIPSRVTFLREDGKAGTPVVGENTTVILTLSNIGNQEADQFQTSLLLDGELYGAKYSEVIPGESNVSIEFNIIFSIGSHTLLFIADELDEIREYDELNNELSVITDVKAEIASESYRFRVHVTDLTQQNVTSIKVKVTSGSHNLENITDGNGNTIIVLDSYPEGTEFLVEAINTDRYASEKIAVYSEDVGSDVELIVGIYSLDVQSTDRDKYISSGEHQNFIINITNSGDFKDEYAVSLNGLPPLWGVNITGQGYTNGSVFIEKDETISLNVDLTSWQYAPAYEMYEMDLIVSSLTAPFAVKDMLLRVTVLLVENITLHTDELNVHGLPGDPISHRVYISNFGNSERTIHMMVTGDTEYSSLNREEISLEPGETKEVLFVIEIPNLRDGTMLFHQIKGIVIGMGETSSLNFTTLIDRTGGQYFAVEMVGDDIVITNNGNHLENITVSLESEFADVSLPSQFYEIDLEGTLTIPLNIEMTDLTVPYGSYIPVYVSIYNGEHYFINRSVDMAIPGVKNLSLSMDNVTIKSLPGTKVNCEILVKNTGNMDETIFFNATSSELDPMFLPPPVTLSQNEQTMVVLQVRIPELSLEDRTILFTGMAGETIVSLDLTISTSIERDAFLDEISIRSTEYGTRYTINLYNKGEVRERFNLITTFGELDITVVEVGVNDHVQFHVAVPYDDHTPETIKVTASSVIGTDFTTELDLIPPPFVELQILGGSPIKTREQIILRATGNYTSYLWQIDSIKILGKVAYYNFTTPGIHYITLTVEDSRDITAVFNTEVWVINQPPNIEVDHVFFGNVGDNIEFDASDSTDPDSIIISHNWIIDDTPHQGPKVYHIFSEEGTFDITLTIIDDGGASNSTTFQITIRESVVILDETDDVEDLSMPAIILSIVALLVVIGILILGFKKLDTEELNLLEKISHHYPVNGKRRVVQEGVSQGMMKIKDEGSSQGMMRNSDSGSSQEVLTNKEHEINQGMTKNSDSGSSHEVLTSKEHEINRGMMKSTEHEINQEMTKNSDQVTVYYNEKGGLQ